MSLRDKIPIIGRKKDKEPEETIVVTVQRKGQKPKSVEPVIKPDVYSDEQDLVAGLQGKRDSKGFQEPKSRGVKTDVKERWDSERLRGLLMNTEDKDKRRLLTVVRKHEFSPIISAETFDQIATLGESRDLVEQSFVKLYLTNRDIRAPSCFPEEGDSRKEVIKTLEIMERAEEASRESIRYGGGG